MKIITDETHVLTVPSDGEFPIQEDLSCWECGNSLHPDEAVPVRIEFDGEPLIVPMCSVCAPSGPLPPCAAAIRPSYIEQDLSDIAAYLITLSGTGDLARFSDLADAIAADLDTEQQEVA